jgi:alpha,alpha-trehalase
VKRRDGAEIVISRSDYDAVIFDLDGVLTRTAELHASAWKELFDEYLHSREGETASFDIEEDYREYVDGKPRYEGAKSFLDSRGIELPFGDAEDPPDRETICGLGNRKNQIFRHRLETEGPGVYETSLTFVERLRRRGFRTAVVSSSKNGALVLEAANITGLFDVRLDGVDAVALDLRGKPHPDTFLEAARRLDVSPARAVVLEDAISGVEAGRDGGFGLVVGIDRSQHEEAAGKALELAGAHRIIRDLSELDIVVRIDELPTALDSLPSIRDLLEDREPVVFLDYDGTLTPIVSRPDEAVLSQKMHDLLEGLARQATVAVLSGRGLSDVRELVGIAGIYYAGSHGFEISGPHGIAMAHEEARKQLPALSEAAKEVAEELRDITGALVETKRFSIAVHYRNVREEDVPRVEQAVDRALGAHSGLRKTHGKKVFELRADVEWDKGKALRWLLARLDLDPKEALPIYVGDDVTDEDAFAALETRGLGIFVGEGDRRTAAHFRAANPDEVGSLLTVVTESLSKRSTWLHSYSGFDPADEKLREALCTLGNGYFATRGAAPESHADGVHYPGTYLAGGYNRLETDIHGRTVENEDLVNQPNWLCLELRLPGEPWFDVSSVEILAYRQELDMKRGLLRRTLRFRDERGRETRLVQRRIVSMAERHLGALQTTIVPLNWSGVLKIRSALDGRVTNSGVERYRELRGNHLEPVESRNVGTDIIFLKARTNQSRLSVAEAAKTSTFKNGRPLHTRRQTEESPGFVAQELEVNLAEGDELTIEKAVSVFSSRDCAISECGLEAVAAVESAGRFDRLLRDHKLAWHHLWRRFETRLELNGDGGDHEVQRIVHLYSFHTLQTTSMHSRDLDVGVPARGWHGEAYRGHIFWDETIVFPFLNYRVPKISRTLLLYRYRRLPEARQAARELGYKGAMFPWQSGSNGREETQKLHLNPRSGRWLPDHSHLQRHINAAIVYNVWQYYQVTADLEFLSLRGAEMILEIARFWASIATYNRELDRYEIRGVMGPDEYHDAYPGAERPGLHNNAYTNVMAVFVLNRALELFELLPDAECRRLCEELGIEESEKKRWNEIRRKMRVAFHDDQIISQFEGYGELAELDWEGYRERYGDIQRLDRILEAEGDTTNRYKVSKQADVLMLFYLFSADELREILGQLGYPFEYETIPRNVEYYLQRTSNGSSLSRIIHAWVASRHDRKRSWALFGEALKTDVADIQGGTTSEGIHLGAMAGSVDILQRCYTGLESRGQVLRLNPQFPEELRSMHLHLRYRDHWLELDLTSDRLRIESLPRGGDPVMVEVKGRRFQLEAGMVKEVEL